MADGKVAPAFEKLRVTIGRKHRPTIELPKQRLRRLLVTDEPEQHLRWGFKFFWQRKSASSRSPDRQRLRTGQIHESTHILDQRLVCIHHQRGSTMQLLQQFISANARHGPRKRDRRFL